VGGHPISLRVSIVPSANGETTAFRTLYRSKVRLGFDIPELSPSEQAFLDSAILCPPDLLPTTDPIGSRFRPSSGRR
jgi:type IV pilus assembly protein PilB